MHQLRVRKEIIINIDEGAELKPKVSKLLSYARGGGGDGII
jgi:hypothetical protein